MTTLCDDCGEDVKRRTRCKGCGKLACSYCLHHLHNRPPPVELDAAAELRADDERDVLEHVRSTRSSVGGDFVRPRFS